MQTRDSDQRESWPSRRTNRLDFHGDAFVRGLHLTLASHELPSLSTVVIIPTDSCWSRSLAHRHDRLESFTVSWLRSCSSGTSSITTDDSLSHGLAFMSHVCLSSRDKSHVLVASMKGVGFRGGAEGALGVFSGIPTTVEA